MVAQHNNIIKDSLLIYKSGSFYNCYNKDAMILSCLFDYKITIDNKCGFLKTDYNKVTRRKNIISSNIKDENSIVKDYKNINNYDNLLLKAIDYVDLEIKKIGLNINLNLQL